MGTATIINALNMELTHSARGTATNTINEKNMLILKLTKV